MEHKWGRNVTKYGLGGVGATLASRYATVFGDYVATNAEAFPGFFWSFYVPPILVVPDAPYLWFALVKQAPHFPYGLVVDPDGPV